MDVAAWQRAWLWLGSWQAATGVFYITPRSHEKTRVEASSKAATTRSLQPFKLARALQAWRLL